MGQLLNLIEKLKTLNVDAVASDAMTRCTVPLADLQRDQLKKGQSSTGGLIGRYKSKSYALKKNLINPLPGLGNVDLILTKDYSKGIKATVDGGKVVVTSGDQKAQHLEKRYGADVIYGLNMEERREFVNGFYRREFLRSIKQVIRL
jgi:hypothetical protein